MIFSGRTTQSECSKIFLYSVEDKRGLTNGHVGASHGSTVEMSPKTGESGESGRLFTKFCGRSNLWRIELEA